MFLHTPGHSFGLAWLIAPRIPGSKASRIVLISYRTLEMEFIVGLGFIRQAYKPLNYLSFEEM